MLDAHYSKTSFLPGFAGVKTADGEKQVDAGDRPHHRARHEVAEPDGGAADASELGAAQDSPLLKRAPISAASQLRAAVRVAVEV